MDRVHVAGLAKLRQGDASKAIRGVVQAIAAVAEEPGEDTLPYLVACYQGAKVLAAAGDIDAAINLMNTVPSEVVEEPAHADTVALLALEVGEGIRRLGDAEAAERVVGLGHGLRREAFGPFHPRTGLSALYAARTCFDLQRFSDAHKFYEAAVVGLGPYHPFNAVAYAERAYAVQLIAPDASPFPEFVMSAPQPYWRRLVAHMAEPPLQMDLDLRIAALLNVSTLVEDDVDGPEDLTRPLLTAAFRFARDAGDDRAGALEEVLQERGWLETAPSSPEIDARTESFWCSPDREVEGALDEQAALFKLFEGAAEASAGHDDPATAAFERVVASRGDDTLEHWAARGSLLLLERGWKLRHQQFKPEMRAIEARALAKLPKAVRSKVQGIEIAPRSGSLDLTFIGRKLTTAQQNEAMQVVHDAISWVTDRSEDAA